MTVAANGANGIVVTGSGNRIGGPTPAARNVLSGNNFAGVALVDGEQNEVQGNLIGTNRLGTASVANLANGILIRNSPQNLIGGTDSGASDLISGNGTNGIELLAHQLSLDLSIHHEGL